MIKSTKKENNRHILKKLPIKYRLPLFDRERREFLFPLIVSLIIHLAIFLYVQLVKLPPPHLKDLSIVSERFVNLIIKESPMNLKKIALLKLKDEQVSSIKEPKRKMPPPKKMTPPKKIPVQKSLPKKFLPKKPLSSKPPTLDMKKKQREPAPKKEEKSEELASLKKPDVKEIKEKRLNIHELGILGRISSPSVSEATDPSIQEIDMLSDEIIHHEDDLLTQIEQIDENQVGDLDEILKNQEDIAQKKIDAIFNNIQLADADNIALPEEEKILDSLQLEPNKAEIISAVSTDEIRSEEVILKVVSSYKASIAYCYQRELKNYPDLKGRITVKFSIGKTNKVLSAEIYSTEINNPNLEKCLIEMILRWRFPPGAEAVTTVIYPFIFFPRL